MHVYPVYSCVYFADYFRSIVMLFLNFPRNVRMFCFKQINKAHYQRLPNFLLVKWQSHSTVLDVQFKCIRNNTVRQYILEYYYLLHFHESYFCLLYRCIVYFFIYRRLDVFPNIWVPRWELARRTSWGKLSRETGLIAMESFRLSTGFNASFPCFKNNVVMSNTIKIYINKQALNY